MSSLQKWLSLLSIATLGALLTFPVLLLQNNIDRSFMNKGMLVATFIWFVTAPFWIGKAKS